MDVKYIPADWEKMRAGLSDLLGHGFGKGMFDHLKDVNEVLEDAERDIAKYDDDGAISFQHTSQKSLYNSLADDFSVLHRFTGKVGDIVDRTIDEPFYKDMDNFVQAVRDLSISNYSTGNRIGAKETVQYGYGAGTTQMEVPKTEVGIDDLLSGGNFYADQMKQQFEEWKVANPDQEISAEEYRMAAVNSRAFEYESIRDKQENKEFWAGIAALVVIVGVSLVCPPAGIALGAAYGVMEVSSAVSGKDWVSGREMSTSERWTRGLLAPLDIIPAAGAVSKFAKGAELARLGDHVGQLGIRTPGAKINAGAHHVQRLANSASNYATTRLRSATNALNDAKNVAINKVARDLVDVGKVVDTSVTWTRNNLNLGRQAVTPDGTVYRIKETAENTHKVETNLKDFLSRFEGINLKAEGTGSVKVQLGKEDLDALRKKWNVPETNTIAVGKTDVKGLEDLTFEGGSPEVRKEAGLPSLDTILPNREIRAPYDHKKNPKLAQFTRHAEEGVLNEFDSIVMKAGIEPTEVTGILRIHQSNPRGVCNKCSKGLLKPYPLEKSGIFYQASKKYPNLTIEVTSEIDDNVKTNGLLSFVLKDGKIIE